MLAQAPYSKQGVKVCVCVRERDWGLESECVSLSLGLSARPASLFQRNKEEKF